MLGWPLNQRSAPAASLAPVTGCPGTGVAKEGSCSPLGTKMTSPKPVAHLKLTESPLAIVTLLG